jgi:hypothetical protein
VSNSLQLERKLRIGGKTGGDTRTRAALLLLGKAFGPELKKEVG